MDANDIAKAIELGKSLDDLKKLKNDIQEAKQEKARLDKNIVIVKRANTEEQTQYEQDKKERQEQITQLESNIKVLEVKRVNLASSTIPEINKLEALKDETSKKLASLERQQNVLAHQAERQNKEKNNIEDKKDILLQISELTKKL